MRASLFSMGIFVFLTLTNLGCQKDGGVVCPTPMLQEVWLGSEVEPRFAKDFAFRFPVQNRNHSPTTVRVRAIGCSCYRVTHQDTVLKVGSLITIPEGDEVTIDLRPPRPVLGETPSYRVVLETVPSAGEPQLVELKASLRTIRDLRASPAVIHQEYTETRSEQIARLEIMHCSRNRNDVDQIPQLTGWPEGSRISELVPLGEAYEEAGIWKRSFKTSAEIPPPDFRKRNELRDVITVTASEQLESRVQLVRRLRSGLSGPGLIHFGQVGVGTTATRRVLLSAQDEIPFRVERLEGNDPLLQMTVDSPTVEKRHWLQFSYTGSAVGEHTQKLQVRTNHPQKPVFEIEVKANVVP